MSDKVAAAVAAEMDRACGDKGYLQEPEKSIARLAANTIALALGETKPAFFVQVQANGSMSRTTGADGQPREVHSLSLTISPFYGYVE